MSFLDADYAAIEARIVNWLAGQEDALQEYREGVDRYKRMASVIYGISEHQVNKHPQRFIGKQAILLCGFQGGPAKFRQTCEKFGYKDMPKGLEDMAVGKFREQHDAIVRYWPAVETAAKNAILTEGKVFRAVPKLRKGESANTKLPTFQNVQFLCKNIEGLRFLLIQLPSGRKLAYPRPRLVPGKFEGTTKIQFFGNTIGTQWGWVDTYGGKLVENCLTGDTQVLSHRRGWVDLSTITIQDQVWDGVEFVEHQGLVKKGRKQVIEMHGIRATPDHLFLGEEGWISAQTACTNPNIQLYSPHGNTSSLATLESVRSEIWSIRSGRERNRQWEEDYLGLPMSVRSKSNKNQQRSSKKRETYSSRMWQGVPFFQSSFGKSTDYAWDEQAPCAPRSSSDACPMFEPQTPSVAQLRWEGNQRMREVAGVFREFLGRYGADLPKWHGHRPSRQRRGLHSRELPMGHPQTQHSESTTHFETRRSTTGFLGCSGGARNQTQHALLSFESRVDVGTDHQHPTGLSEQVYDLLNCGPRHQFVVRSKHESGRLLISHNCTQAVAADIMTNGVHQTERAGYETATLIHDQALAYYRDGQTPEEFVRLLTTLPAWAKGLPIEAEGALVSFYKKD